MVNNKWKLRSLVTLLTVSIVCAIFSISLLVDSHFDEKSCRQALDFPEEPKCYANDDIKHLNFGMNIDCTCFFGSFEELTLDMIEFTILSK